MLKILMVLIQGKPHVDERSSFKSGLHKTYDKIIVFAKDDELK